MSVRLLQGGGTRHLQGGGNRLLEGVGVPQPGVPPAGGASGGENDNALRGWWGDLGHLRRRLRPVRCRTSARLPAILVVQLPDVPAPELTPLPPPVPVRIDLDPARAAARPRPPACSGAAALTLSAASVPWWGQWRAELRGRLAAEEELLLLSGWPD